MTTYLIRVTVEKLCEYELAIKSDRPLEEIRYYVREHVDAEWFAETFESASWDNGCENYQDIITHSEIITEGELFDNAVSFDEVKKEVEKLLT